MNGPNDANGGPRDQLQSIQTDFVPISGSDHAVTAAVTNPEHPQQIVPAAHGAAAASSAAAIGLGRETRLGSGDQT
jgi:hypothetical protein